MRIALVLGLAACTALAAPVSAMPVSGIGQAADAQGAGNALVQKVEFVRFPDGRVEYRRPRFNTRETHYFAYQGYAYPYNPGYTYRLLRGELRPSDRPRRYRIAD
jgi:hypothetical protein